MVVVILYAAIQGLDGLDGPGFAQAESPLEQVSQLCMVNPFVVILVGFGSAAGPYGWWLSTQWG